MPGLHHHHVGALVEVELDLAQRLVAVGRVHLIGALVALERAGRAQRIAERPVEGGGVFGRIGHDLHVEEALRVERLADRPDPSVHHVGGRDDIGAGARLIERLAHERLDRLVVQDPDLA